MKLQERYTIQMNIADGPMLFNLDGLVVRDLENS